MPKYLVTVQYSAEGAKGLRKDGGTKRRHVVSKAVEAMGGKLESVYFALNGDAVVVLDLPDSVGGTALSLAVRAAGTGELAITPLLTAEEMDKAAGKKTAYKAPGA